MYKACHLQIKTVFLLLPFQFWWLLFLFLAWLLWLGLSELCWTGIVRKWAPYLVLIIWNFQPFSNEYNVNWSSYKTFIMLRYYIVYINEWMLNRLKYIFSASIEMFTYLFFRLIWCITVIYLHVLKHSCILRINSTWS